MIISTCQIGVSVTLLNPQIPTPQDRTQEDCSNRLHLRVPLSQNHYEKFCASWSSFLNGRLSPLNIRSAKASSHLDFCCCCPLQKHNDFLIPLTTWVAQTSMELKLFSRSKHKGERGKASSKMLYWFLTSQSRVITLVVKGYTHDQASQKTLLDN